MGFGIIPGDLTATIIKRGRKQLMEDSIKAYITEEAVLQRGQLQLAMEKVGRKINRLERVFPNQEQEAIDKMKGRLQNLKNAFQVCMEALSDYDK